MACIYVRVVGESVSIKNERKFPVEQSNVLDLMAIAISIDRKILGHSAKSALVSLIVNMDGNLCCTPNNVEFANWIGDNKKYARTLISDLKRDGYIRVDGKGDDRRIYVVPEKLKKLRELAASDVS